MKYRLSGRSQDWRKKFELMDARELEFVWRSDASLGPESDLWIHVLPFHYSTPGVNREWLLPPAPPIAR